MTNPVERDWQPRILGTDVFLRLMACWRWLAACHLNAMNFKKKVPNNKIRLGVWPWLCWTILTDCTRLKESRRCMNSLTIGLVRQQTWGFKSLHIELVLLKLIVSLVCHWCILGVLEFVCLFIYFNFFPGRMSSRKFFNEDESSISSSKPHVLDTQWTGEISVCTVDFEVSIWSFSVCCLGAIRFLTHRNCWQFPGCWVNRADRK